MAQLLRALAALVEDQVTFPECVWQLIAFYNSSSRGSNSHFCPPQALDMCVVHIKTGRQNLIYIKNISLYKRNYNSIKIILDP